MDNYESVGRDAELEPDLDYDDPGGDDHLPEVGEDEPGEEPTTGSDPERVTIASGGDWFEVYKSEINRRPARPVFTGGHGHDPFEQKNSRGRPRREVETAA
jgi:hypothetical protein